MKRLSLDSILEATRLTTKGKLGEATALLQRNLGSPSPAPAPTHHHDGPVIDGLVIEGVAEPARAAPAQGRFLTAKFSNAAGSRNYRLYVPSSYHGQPMPLIVMLHGCTQSPTDFARGTRMNEAAETRHCLVAYPEQSKSANANRCWNWFLPADQQRDHGEPALIAGITRQIMSDYAVDPRQVFIAGLSAGGAAAAIMGIAYPDLYAAIGVHSGLACGAATDMVSAFNAMRAGHAGHDLAGATTPPAIIFHGDHDHTVNARNADALADQLLPPGSPRAAPVEHQAPGSHPYSLTRHTDARGRVILEQWLIHGAGHAWQGGSTKGTFTDPTGPDATTEMLRFFLTHSPA